MATVNYTPGNLPAEYQGELSAIDQQKRMAEMLMQKSMKERPAGQMVGRHFVPTSPLFALSDAMDKYYARKDLSAADSARSGVLQRAEMDRTAEQADLLSYTQPKFSAGEEGPARQDPDYNTLVTRGPAARFKENRDLAGALLKQRMDLFSAGSRGASPESLISGVQAGGDPNRLAARPTERWDTATVPALPGPDGLPRSQIRQTSSITGQQRVLDETPNQMKVSATATANGGNVHAEKKGIEFAFAQMKESEAPARAQAQSLVSIQEALAGLDMGVKTGRLSGAEQFVRGVMESRGVEKTGAEGFDGLASSLKRITFTSLGGLGKQISDADRMFMEQTTGSTLQEPMALRRALAITAAANMQSVSAHNQRAQTMAQSYPEIAPLLQSSVVNFRFTPGTSTKPGQELVGDKMLQAVLAGKSTFDVVPPEPTKGIVDAGKAAAKGPVDPAKPLSPAEQKRVEELRRRLGLTK
jgi:hypothetical protein